MSDNSKINTKLKKTYTLLNKCISQIGIKKTNDALVRATSNPIYLVGDYKYNIIKIVSKEFGINPDNLFAIHDESLVNKETLNAQKISMAMLVKFTKIRLQNLALMYTQPKSIPTLCRYVASVDTWQEKLNELNYIVNKISDSKAKISYNKKIKYIKDLLSKVSKIENKIKKLYNDEQ